MGSAAGCGTPPEPITPGTGRWKYGIRFLYRIDSQGHVEVTPQPQEKGEIGDKTYLEPHMAAMSFYRTTE